MTKDSPLVILDKEVSRNSDVLTIVSPSRNSTTQFYSERVQVSQPAIENLNQKLIDKLRLHRINPVRANFAIQFANDRTVNLDSVEKFCSLDTKVDHLTQILTARWTFVFDPDGNGDDHVHSIYVRVCERPNPGVIFQRMLSNRNEDHDALDGEAFATVSCKIDFFEGRFSSELLAVVTEWVKALPKAEPSFGAARWLRKYSDPITSFIYGTFPSMVVLSSLGIWIGFLPTEMTNSIKSAVAWILLTNVAFLLARYGAKTFNRVLERNLRRICDVPVFQITSGDNNKMTRYLATSHRSIYNLIFSGLGYGALNTIGGYLVTVLILRFSA
jgi:hypothetical protein